MKNVGRPTRILFCSYAFHPSIGGIETMSSFLVEHLIRRGLDVEVVTNSPEIPGIKTAYGCPVIRRPGRKELLSLFRRSDLVFQNNISLNYLWPLLLAPRPLVIANHTPIDATVEKSAIKRRLKFLILRFASTISVSRFLASTFPTPSRVIYNALRADIFHLDAQVERNRHLVFVGRLSDAKGIDILLHALSLLRQKGLKPGLTIIGGGAEEQKLKALATNLGLDGQTDFIGLRQGPEIAHILNQHQILVVPSRRKPAEALGIVAMEGIACGAVPVVAAQGGLPEAIGPCGLTFECENPQSLADTLERVLASAELREQLRVPAADFLQKFDAEAVVDQYIDVFSAAMPGGKLIYRA
jgi:glycogen(starch) synthase